MTRLRARARAARIDPAANRTPSGPTRPVGAQVVPQVGVRELLVVGLLLAGQRPDLDHGGARRADVGQGQQDRLPVGAPRRHLGLGGEHHVARPAAAVEALRRIAGQERQPARARRPGRGRSAAASRGELLALATAVHHQQVAVAAVRHGPSRRRDADPRQTGDQDGPAATADHPQTGQHGDGRARCRPAAARRAGRGAPAEPEPAETEPGDRGAGRGHAPGPATGRSARRAAPDGAASRPAAGRGSRRSTSGRSRRRRRPAPAPGVAQKSPAADRGGVSSVVSSSHWSSDIAERANRALTIASVACCSTC